MLEVQLKRLGGSHPLCSSQCRMAVPGEGGRKRRRGEEVQLRKGWRRVSYAAIIIWKFDDLEKSHPTEGSPGAGHGCRETKLGPGPPDSCLDGLRAAVVDHWEDTVNYLWHKCHQDDERSSALTFATVGGDLSEGVVAAVALASDHAGLALALAAVPVAGSGEGAERVAVAQQAAAAALGAVVVVLDANGEEELVMGVQSTPPLLRVTAGTFLSLSLLILFNTFTLFLWIIRFETHIK